MYIARFLSGFIFASLKLREKKWRCCSVVGFIFIYKERHYINGQWKWVYQKGHHHHQQHHTLNGWCVFVYYVSRDERQTFMYTYLTMKNYLYTFYINKINSTFDADVVLGKISFILALGDECLATISFFAPVFLLCFFFRWNPFGWYWKFSSFSMFTLSPRTSDFTVAVEMINYERWTFFYFS